MEKKPAPACLVGGTAMQYWSSRRGPTLVLSFLQERPRIVRTLHPTMCSRCESRGGGTGINCSRVLEVWACQVAHMVVGSVGFVGSSGRRQREPDGRPAPTALWGEPESSQSETDSWPSSSNRDSYTRVWPPERNLFYWEKKVQVWEVFPPPPSSCDQNKVFQCFLVNEASDVGSEWLLRASEGNQEILSDVGETQLSETANQIGRRWMCPILSAKYYLDDPLTQAQISRLPCWGMGWNLFVPILQNIIWP